MHFLVTEIARTTQATPEAVSEVLAEAAHHLRDEYPGAADELEQAVAAAAPVDPNAPTLPL